MVAEVPQRTVDQIDTPATDEATQDTFFMTRQREAKNHKIFPPKPPFSCYDGSNTKEVYE